MKLKNISQVKLSKILKQHQKWLDSGGAKGHQADLNYTDLSGMDLKGANLQRANLQCACLQNADLRGARLQGADLWYADFQNADLIRIDLKGANLQGTSLRGVNLYDANLQGVNLQEADLWNANLGDADLKEARLSWVSWYGVKNIKVYVAGLQFPNENAQLTYIPSIDIATIGSWQGTWQETTKKFNNACAGEARERKACDLAIEYIQAQMDLDSVED